MARAFALLLFAVALTSPLPTPADSAERTSTASDRQVINLTIYNGGTALVHDRRRIMLRSGTNRIAWRDVSAQMDATSALLAPLGSSNAVSVLEQNFDYDLLDPSALLQKYVGREVTVVHDARFAGERATRERARILSANNGIVLQYADRIETELRGYILYPSLPKNFRDIPTLDLDLESAQSRVQTMDLSYLTGGLTWRADYVGALSGDDRHMALTGLVTLSNTSGASYQDARLQLVAGDVNVVPQGQTTSDIVKTIATVRSSARFSQENYFEYHLYTLGRPTTILDKQTKQLSLLGAPDVPVSKTLELRGSGNYYSTQQADLGDRLPVGVYITFQNLGGDLGVPLPGGVVRIYQTDSRNVSQFLGSDSIGHTPKGGTVRLYLGNSFDITARNRQTSFSITGPCSSQSTYNIVVSNAEEREADVLIVESIPGDWQIPDENLPHVKSSAGTADWTVHVPAAGTARLTYSARTRWCWDDH